MQKRNEFGMPVLEHFEEPEPEPTILHSTCFAYSGEPKNKVMTEWDLLNEDLTKK